MNGGEPTKIVSLAFGSADLYRQTVFSFLTLCYHLKGDFTGIQIVIYTDNSALFNKYLGALSLKIETITKGQLQLFKGPTGKNVYRIKTCILKDCLDKYAGNVFYIDCDTFFLKNPWPLFEKISQDVSILNAMEYDLYDAGGWENLIWFKLRSILRERVFTVGGKPIKIPLTTTMWNGGIIGISHKNAQLTNEILDLTDQIFDVGQIHLTEQFAVSYILQERTKVIGTDDYILHYWSKPVKNTYSYHFRSFFAANKNLPLPELAGNAYRFFENRDKLEVQEFKKEPVAKRLLKRLQLTMTVAKRGYL